MDGGAEGTSWSCEAGHRRHDGRGQLQYWLATSARVSFQANAIHAIFEYGFPSRESWQCDREGKLGGIVVGVFGKGGGVGVCGWKQQKRQREEREWDY